MLTPLIDRRLLSLARRWRLALASIAMAAALLGVAETASAQQRPPAAPTATASAVPEVKENVYSQVVLLKIPVGGLEVSVEEVLRDAGERLKKVVVIDEALRGKKIKFYTSAEINFNMLKNILGMFGVELLFEVVDGREFLKVFMQRNLAQLIVPVPTPFFKEGEKLPDTEQIVTAVYTVKNVDAAGVMNTIRGMQTRDPRRVGNVFQAPRSDTLLITDVRSAVDFYLKVVGALDTPVQGFEYKIVQIQYALADELANLVNALYRQLEASGATTGGAPAGAPGAPPAAPRAPGQAGGAGQVQAQVVPDARTNKVVILALPNEISRIEKLIREVDVRVDPPPRHFHVYKCVNAYAADLADRLNQLFGGVGAGTTSSRQRTTLGTGTTSTRRTTGATGGAGGLSRSGSNLGVGRQGIGQPLGAAALPAAAAARAGATGATGPQVNPGESVVETRIVPDEQTNSLLIQAAPDDYREILAILKELDKKRVRVMIECQVWEVLTSDDLLFAIETAITDDASTNTNPDPLRGHGLANFGLTVPTIDPANPNSIALVPNFGQVAGVANTLSQGGLIFALTKGGFDKIPLIIQALAGESNANLLTTPFAMTNDNEQATFEIGDSRPFQIATSTGSSGNLFSGFDQADATSSLSIVPRVSSGNNLTLQVDLRIESFGASTNPSAPPPSTSRAFNGTVTVPNRQYVIFGGLEQETVRESRTKLPFIGDIPYLGYLFGKTSMQKSRARIYVFIRPIIFTDDDFSAERRSSGFLHDQIRAESTIGADKTTPVLPDEILDAEAPGLKAALFGLFGDGATTAYPENETTREMRRAAAAGGR